jgi:signal transduction histidine kinase
LASPAGADNIRRVLVLNKPPNLWELSRWQIFGVASLCIVEALLIAGLLMERANRRRAEEDLRRNQRAMRSLTGRLLHAQEEERRRIARELHDDLNQSLALLAVELDLLGQKPPDSLAQLGGRIHELSGRVKQLSSSVHALSHLLHPSKLEQLGLVAAVRGLCQEVTHGHGLAIEFVAQQVPATIPDGAALCLYRITQEALRNILKHSGAPHARVELRGSGDTVCLRIADDGSGFDSGSVACREGLGLLGMRERLSLLGGTVAIDSRPGGGTRIDVRLPLGAPATRWREDLSHPELAPV